MSNILEEIAKRERTIMLLGYDVIGTSAASNVDRMKALQAEIENLQLYGSTRPTLPQRLMRVLAKTSVARTLQPRPNRHKQGINNDEQSIHPKTKK